MSKDPTAAFKDLADKMSAEFCTLHGKLFKLMEWQGWLEFTERELWKSALRNHNWHPKATSLGLSNRDGYQVMEALLAAPADSMPLGDVSIIGKNQTLMEGLPVSGTAFRNCVVDLKEERVRTKTGELARDTVRKRYVYRAEFDVRERSRLEIFYDEIPWNWLAEVPEIERDAPNFSRFLAEYCLDAISKDGRTEREWVEDAGKLRDILWIMMGNCFFGNILQKFYLLQGEGGSGKGVLVQFLQWLLGKDNTKAVDIDMLDSRFELWEMRHKKAAFLNEIPPRAKSLTAMRHKRDKAYSTLKEIIGADPVRMEGKFVQKQFSDVVSAVFIGTTNVPSTYSMDGELGGGWKRRLVVMPSPPMIPEHQQDHMLKQSFLGEEEVVIRYASEMFLQAVRSREMPSVAEVQQMTTAAAESDLAALLELFESAGSDEKVWNPILRAVLQAELGLMVDERVPDNLFDALRESLIAKYSCRSVEPKWCPALSCSQRSLQGLRFRDSVVEKQFIDMVLDKKQIVENRIKGA